MEWLEEPALARALYEILRAEQDMETLKQSLSLRPDFNIADCYSIFDTQCQGFISRLQFEEVYTIHMLYPSTYDICLLLSRYNLTRNGSLHYDEFVDMIAPRDEKYKEILLARKSKHCGHAFSRANCFI
jgi:Ca2+-binding EF-hand superfamily protein